MTIRCKGDVQSLLADYQQALQLVQQAPQLSVLPSKIDPQRLLDYHEFFLRNQHLLLREPRLFLQQAASWHKPSVQLPATEQLRNSSRPRSPVLRLLFPPPLRPITGPPLAVRTRWSLRSRPCHRLHCGTLRIPCCCHKMPDSRPRCQHWQSETADRNATPPRRAD